MTQPGTFHRAQQAQSRLGQPPSGGPNPCWLTQVPDWLPKRARHLSRIDYRICMSPCSKVIDNVKMGTLEY